MDIEQHRRIAIDYWCGADSVKLSRRLGRFFTDRPFHAFPSPVAGLSLARAVRRPGQFEAALMETMGQQEALLKQHSSLAVFGMPLLWIAAVQAQGRNLSNSVVGRASALLSRWDLLIVPGDGLLSPGGWYADPQAILALGGEGWRLGAQTFDTNRQTVMPVTRLIARMEESNLWP